MLAGIAACSVIALVLAQGTLRQRRERVAERATEQAAD
jgi:hypothetical protein